MTPTTRDLINALTAIATQAENAARAFPNAPGRGDHVQIARIARDAIAKAKGPSANADPTGPRLTRASLLRLQAMGSEEMTETTWGDFIDFNGLSWAEMGEIGKKLIAARKAVVGGGAAPVVTLFWPTKEVTP